MTARPAIPVKTKVDVAIRQAHDGAIICRLCGCRLRPDDRRVLEHNPPRALLKANGIKDPDHPRYLEWVHWACAQIKTRGCEGESKKGSVADGDIHKVAKATRIADGGKTVRHPMRKASEEIKAANRERRKQFRQQLKSEGRV